MNFKEIDILRDELSKMLTNLTVDQMEEYQIKKKHYETERQKVISGIMAKYPAPDFENIINELIKKD